MLDQIDLATRLLNIARPFAPGLPKADAEAHAASLPNAGLTSMAAVKLMLAIEAEFAIAIPDADLTPENFATLDAVADMIVRLRG